jgi:uncharacterized protein YndB with AHSA1/START domain/DNA-binding transcriptional ArsR family regulator
MRTCAAPLADPTRRRILAQLAKGDECVTDLARPHAMSLAAVSKHLIVLEKAGLVKRRRQGWVHSLALETKPMKQAQAWIDRYRKFWEGNLDQFENIWTNYKQRRPNMVMINNDVQKPDDATLIVKRMLNAPQELVFKAWTTPEHIQQWMRPETGMVVPFASMDLRVGGRYRIQMQKPDGEFEKDGCGVKFGELEGKPSLITAEFFKRGKQTEFVLTHSRFANVENRDNHARGWSKIAESFASFVEKE